jgi:tetratricopeptide (TPR) repeat protein
VRWRAPALAAIAATVVLAPSGSRGGAARVASTCVEDDPVPTPPSYAGWERSSVVAWQEIERRGGVLPDIDEDPSQAPPGWWRYPSPLRSAALLADEANNAKAGLYEAVAPNDIKPGDILVRARDAAPCGKMTVIAGTLEDKWVTIAAGDGPDPLTTSGDPTYFDGKALRPDVGAYRIRVKKDATLSHVRELERDLDHLERTISERPPLVVRSGAAVVDTKVHDLVDEASSLVADPAFDDDRRALTGRALALGAALDWPAASAEAAAVLDEELRRSPMRADAIAARVAVELEAGHADRALTLADDAAAVPGIPARIHYLLARALYANGKSQEAAAELRRYRTIDAYDALAVRLARAATRATTVPLAPPPPPPADGPRSTLQISATAEHGALESPAYQFGLEWPIAWRLTAIESAGSDLLVGFDTERVLRDDGEAERATTTVLAQRPQGGTAAVARKAARNVFPDAALKPLPPLLAGSRREQFRERAEGAARLGEVTTLERNGTVFFLILNATPKSYPKLKGEYAAVVKSFTPPSAAAAHPPPKP